MTATQAPAGAVEGRKLMAVTIILPIALWAFGYSSARWRGCDPESALLKATAYALSWLPGWLTYWIVLGRRWWRNPRLLFANLMPAGVFANITFLEPKATPWPFWEMLKFGFASSIIAGLVVGLALRGWMGLLRAVEVNEARRSTPPPPSPPGRHASS